MEFSCPVGGFWGGGRRHCVALGAPVKRFGRHRGSEGAPRDPKATRRRPNVGQPQPKCPEGHVVPARKRKSTRTEEKHQKQKPTPHAEPLRDLDLERCAPGDVV